MNKKVLCLLVIFTIFVIAIVGCGKNDKEVTQPPEQVTTPDNDNVSGHVSDDTKELAKDNPYTEEEMLNAGREAAAKMNSIYVASDEKDIEEVLSIYADPESYREVAKEFYSPGDNRNYRIYFESESVEKVGATNFRYKAKITTQVTGAKSNKEYKMVEAIDFEFIKNDEGKFKLVNIKSTLISSE